MGIENLSPEQPRKPWRGFVVILVLFVIGLLVLQITGIRKNDEEKTANGGGSYSSLMQGDLYVKLALANLMKGMTGSYARQAIDIYSDALPWPAAYRRIAVVKKSILRESNVKEFYLINSPKAIKGLSKNQIKRLSREVAMWREVFSGRKLTQSQTMTFVSQVKKLNLGPLKSVAVAEVYSKAGDKAKADAAFHSAKDIAFASIVTAGVIAGVLFFAGIIGLALAVMFLVKDAPYFSTAPRYLVQESMLFAAFFAYMFSYFILGEVGNALVSDEFRSLVMQVFVMLIAYGFGLAMIRALAIDPRDVMRKIGYKLIPIKKAIVWGVGGYISAIPLLAVAAIISYVLTNVFFKDIPTPEHPLVPVVGFGSGLTVFVVVFMGVVLAPLIEETFFRGMLYGALRANMGVWPSVIISGAIFALVHPTLPGQFLPILVLGCILALLREKTGSLLPGMICHGLNNAVAFLMVRLFY